MTIRRIETTRDAIEFIDGIVPTLDLSPDDQQAVKAVMYQFAARLRRDLNITVADDGDVTVDATDNLLN